MPEGKGSGKGHSHDDDNPGPSPIPGRSGAAGESPNAQARNDAEQALAAVAAIQSELKSLTENLNKLQQSYVADKTKILDVTDPGADEAWKAWVLKQAYNQKFFGDVIEAQVLQSREDALKHRANLDAAMVENIRNQNATSVATTLNGIDKLQNIDVREGTGIAAILEALGINLKPEE